MGGPIHNPAGLTGPARKRIVAPHASGTKGETRMAKIVPLLLALLAGLAGQAQAQETSPQPDAAIPATYAENRTPRANPEKPADQRARETAQADADEAACNTRTWAACTALGRAYHRGEGRPQNRPVAELLYRRACNAADGDACLQLGKMLDLERADFAPRVNIQYFVRACTLGALEGCDFQADALLFGQLGEPDPAAAEALLRKICALGRDTSCRALARALLREERQPEEQDEGRAIIDRLCRAGDGEACRAGANHWDRLIMPDAAARLSLYRDLGCTAGDADLCVQNARAIFQSGSGAAQRDLALTYLDKACAIDGRFSCRDAADIREEPALRQGCDNGDGDACLSLGRILMLQGHLLEDRPTALTLLASSCEAGQNSACPLAAGMLIDAARYDQATPEPARIQAYLTQACTAGTLGACETLADELASGALLAQDTALAAELYVDQCDNGRIDACNFLEAQALIDPAAPLMLAGEGFVPALTPEEAEAELQRQLAEAREYQRLDRATHCTTTTVEFEDEIYTDTVCDAPSPPRIMRGFAVKPGAAPWQALLWRPPVMQNTTLTASERILCGGAVIGYGWILTAAHCLTDLGGVSIAKAGHRVRLGLSNPLSDEGYFYPILRIEPHPSYDRSTFAFDIALVQYDPRAGTRGSQVEVVPGRIRLDPRPMAGRPIKAGDVAYTYGWGWTAMTGGKAPEQLRGAKLQLRGEADCNLITKFRDHRTNSVLCAAGSEGQQACFGDSGGPLITYADTGKVPTVIGVVSAGVKCGTTGVPSRYVRVTHPVVQSWLNRILPPSRRR